jgi:hypothetical protein
VPVLPPKGFLDAQSNATVPEEEKKEVSKPKKLVASSGAVSQASALSIGSGVMNKTRASTAKSTMSF